MQRVLESAVLVGEQVHLRPHEPGDAERAFELLHGRDPILRWLVWDGPSSPAELEAYYRDWRVGDDEAHDYHLAIVRNEDDALVGSLGLRFLGHPGTGDLGYWLGEPYWGRGHASEAVRLACRLAFRHLAAHTLSSSVFVGNLASRRVLEKNGFRLVRTAQRSVRGAPQPEWALALLAREWEQADGDWAPEERVRLSRVTPHGERRG